MCLSEGSLLLWRQGQAFRAPSSEPSEEEAAESPPPRLGDKGHSFHMNSRCLDLKSSLLSVTSVLRTSEARGLGVSHVVSKRARIAPNSRRAVQGHGHSSVNGLLLPSSTTSRVHVIKGSHESADTELPR